MAIKPLVFIDFDSAGHHPSHVCHLVDFAASHNRTDVSFLLPTGLYNNVRSHLTPHQDQYLSLRIQLLEDDPVWCRMVRWAPFPSIARWLYFEYLNVHARKSSRLFFLFLDSIVYPVALLPLPRFDISGVLFRPTFYYRQRRMLNRGAAASLLFSLKYTVAYLCTKRTGISRLIVLDPLAEDYAVRYWHTAKIKQVPDPMGPPANGSRPIGQASPVMDRPLKLLIAGSLAPRKGLHLVVEALSKSPESTRKIVLLVIVGQPEKGSENYIRQNLARLKELQVSVESQIRFVTDAEMDNRFIDSHIILTPYVKFKGSSGIVIRAAHFGKPVISTNEGLLGYLVAQHGLGQATDVSNAPHLSQCFDRIAATGIVEGYDPISARAFADSSDPQEFARVVTTNL